ncbi:MAG: hypothetical protein BJ554DRAFT_1535 [Olpidium bornovanus]|uniref:Uncharacterized protein n=1 Tax=Olpidium bornovanus TaxID=278681 RepID=A0A8H8A0X8_9FUNG|nr:MAG: hypothetical protein BJ554DRAFT_1535 [Olpidium bornovanus]
MFRAGSSSRPATIGFFFSRLSSRTPSSRLRPIRARPIPIFPHPPRRRRHLPALPRPAFPSSPPPPPPPPQPPRGADPAEHACCAESGAPPEGPADRRAFRGGNGGFAAADIAGRGQGPRLQADELQAGAAQVLGRPGRVLRLSRQAPRARRQQGYSRRRRGVPAAEGSVPRRVRGVLGGFC